MQYLIKFVVVVVVSREERNMAEFTAEQLSGLAGEIRSSLTSDQYDLGGYTEQRAKDLIHSAFRYIKISKHEIHGTRFERCFPSFSCR